MSRPAIEVDALSKRYLISHRGTTGNRTLRDDLVRAVSRRRRSEQPGAASTEEFWALKEVSFTVDRGDVVGIIGRNGSGKSTLLKILSRIVDPTAGEAVMRGKVASLLEVGTGFHPELTGRENIYFNGAILGMTKRQIEQRFDNIVAFAETERFLDTPVKFYSSGMYVRLAFAVAAHLDPDILIVDEVLAVGDAQFQKKCLGRMSQAANEGKTVLFVSHNMNAVQQLCSKAVYLKDGQVVSQGDVAPILHDYIYANRGHTSLASWRSDGELSHPCFTAESMALLDEDGAVLTGPARADRAVTVEICGSVERPDPLLTVGYALYAESGECLFWSYQTDQDPADWPDMGPGRVTLRGTIPPGLLNEGDYRLELLASLHFKEWLLEPNMNAPSVSLTVAGGMSPSPYFQTKRPTSLAPVLPWRRT